jgi:hypothetical protein
VLHAGSVRCYAAPIGTTQSGGPPWDIAGINDAEEVTYSLEQACARRTSGTVTCWGFSHHSQLGLAVPPGTTTQVPVDLPAVSVVRLATGHHALCGIEPSGTALCWGGAYEGPLGDPTLHETQNPVPVMGAVNHTIDVAMSADHACAVLDSGRVLCWIDHAAPYVIDGISDAVKVAVALPSNMDDIRACALRADGTVACWSDTMVALVPDLSDVVQISGAVWGSNLAARTSAGKVFLLTSAGAATPLPIHDAVDVSAGYHGTCVVHADASIDCWSPDGIGAAFPQSPP